MTRSGRTAPLDEWLTPQVDRFVIMDYYGVADSAATQSRIVSQAQREGATAAALSREWILGLNVAPGSATDETLADEGSAAFVAAERAAQTAYAGTAGYQGSAVYDYDGFVVLGP